MVHKAVLALGAVLPIWLVAAPVQAQVSQGSGQGYWVVESNGQVYSFGGAPYYGGAEHLHLNAPIIGMVAAPDGQGYWLVGKDGGVFSFGSARFYGSLPKGSLGVVTDKVVAMAAVPGPTIGPAGPQGDQGAIGPQGPVGPQGPPGTSGSSSVGPAGPQGVAGPQGASGVPGAQGSQGAQGPQGQIGPAGPQGATGNQGSQGNQGNQGPQGVPGPVVMVDANRGNDVVTVTSIETKVVSVPITLSEGTKVMATATATLGPLAGTDANVTCTLSIPTKGSYSILASTTPDSPYTPIAVTGYFPDLADGTAYTVGLSCQLGAGSGSAYLRFVTLNAWGGGD
jgi:hypothetical protein